MIGTKAALIAYIETLPDDATKYVIEKYREKRSKDANSLFHALADKLRLELGVSMARIKNQLVADYGEVIYLENGDMATFKSNVPPDFMAEAEEPHTKYLRTDVENGKEVHWYRLYHRTRDLDNKQMGKLIDGTIEECKQMGIDTTNPREVERLKALWGV